MRYELPKLSYAYHALEPHIDAVTMEIHHSKHHAAYVAKLNEALAKYPSETDRPLEALLATLDSVPEDIRTAVRNHGGGHLNHSFFWESMSPQGGGEPTGALLKHLTQTFGSYTVFQKQFSDAALGVFGSGWAWLAVDTKNTLTIATTPNQDSPLMQHLTPILGLDVWEHAYYLKHQNRRTDYIASWWHTVNWGRVAERLEK